MGLPQLAATLLLLAWAALLGTAHLDVPSRLIGGGSLLDVRSASGAWAVARGLLLWAGLQAARFLPLGLLSVLALPDRGSRLARAVGVALPAAGLGLVLAALALTARAGLSPPGPLELVLPALGILLGVWAGLAWRRGWWSRLVFLPKLAALAALLLLGGLALAVRVLEREAALPESAPLSSEDRRQLVSLFRGKDPRRIPPGETRTLRLSARELDQLVAWAASVALRARTAVSLVPGGVTARVSVRVPGTSRWLNASTAAQVGIESGKPSLAAPRLQVGGLAVPPPLLDALAPLAVAGVRADRDLRRVLPAVRSLAIGGGEASLTYGRVDMPRGLIARLVWGEEASEGVRAAVYTHVDSLLVALPATPPGDARFAAAYETAFTLARERSAAGASAVAENRAALLALGIVFGHPRVANAVGEKLDEERYATALGARRGTTLRGREDWTRHFALSGALTVVAAVSPSDAAGLLKEELDADGGSGFSFADLLADRAGTTLAEVATRDEASARAVQARLAAGFRVDDFFPSASGLPEGIPDTELRSRYGGVGGPLYLKHTNDIERRLSACAAYRD